MLQELYKVSLESTLMYWMPLEQAISLHFLPLLGLCYLFIYPKGLELSRMLFYTYSGHTQIKYLKCSKHSQV